MAMSTDEAAELTASYKMMSADELRAQLGDSDDEDALINAVLDDGKAVETKGGKAAQADADEDQDDEPAAKVAPDDEDEDEEDEPAAKADVAAAAVAEVAEVAEVGEVLDLSADVPRLDLSFINDKYTTSLAALDEAKAAKLQDMMDGVIDAKEYSKADADYMRERDALKDQRASDSEWMGEVHAFKVEAARNGVNYSADEEKMSAFDDWVKRLAAKPENAEREGKWFLEQAHKKVLAEFDIAPPSAKTAPAKPAAPAKAKGRAPDLSNIPPSLGGLPAAAETETGGDGEFAGLDKLSGMAFEQALARLTPDQKARYEQE